MNTELPESEWAIALAAWVSLHCLKPVPWGDDEVAAAITWKDAGQVKEHGESLFRSDPEGYTNIPKQTLLTASRVLPDDNPEALWRYHFFECTTDASQTRAGALLRAVSNALQSDRLLPNVPPTRVGRYIIGSLGVIAASDNGHGCSAGWFHRYARGSYAEFGSLVAEHVMGIIVALPDGINLAGWSDTWIKWHEHHGPVCRHECGSAEPNRWMLKSRRDIGPPPHLGAQASDLRLLGELRDSVDSNVLSLPQDQLSQILKECVTHRRRAFFDDIDWTNARRGKDYLTGRDVQMGCSDLRQILMLPPPHTVIASAIERGFLKPTTHRRESFAERLTEVLMHAGATNARCQDWAARFARSAGGPEFDRLLHYIVKTDPVEVLSNALGSSDDMSAVLAQLTCAPLRFHDPDSWDAANPQQTAALLTHVLTLLGYQAEPSPPARAMPYVVPAYPAGEAMSALDAVASARRRIEYLFKTAVQYLYALLASHEWVPGVSLRHESDSPPSPAHFWCDQTFVATVTRRVTAGPGRPLAVPEDARLTLGDLRTLLAATGNLVAPSAPAVLIAVRDAHRQMNSMLDEPSMMECLNEPNHDNTFNQQRIIECAQMLGRLDRDLRCITDALPTLTLFVSSTVLPNRPRVVCTEPYLPVGFVHDGVKHEHYLSNRSMEFRRDRVYSFTDVTRNHVSVNPIVLDWTSWMKWSDIT